MALKTNDRLNEVEQTIQRWRDNLYILISITVLCVVAIISYLVGEQLGETNQRNATIVLTGNSLYGVATFGVCASSDIPGGLKSVLACAVDKRNR